MGVRHVELPIHGVQFHPESILTEGGHRMLANWLGYCGTAPAESLVRTLEDEVADTRCARLRAKLSVIVAPKFTALPAAGLWVTTAVGPLTAVLARRHPCPAPRSSPARAGAARRRSRTGRVGRAS